MLLSTSLGRAFPLSNDDGKPILDAAIGPPDQAQINNLCSERDWRNPLIGVTADGHYTIKSLSRPVYQTIAASELRSALASLPVTDWPYGRIVAIPRQNERPNALELVQHEPISAAIIPMRVSWWIWPHERYCTVAPLNPR